MHRVYTMKKLALLLILAAATFHARADNPRVWLDTDQGSILIELFEDKAPITTTHFLRYVDEGFYDGLVFHRVIRDFMIQGGGFDPNHAQRTPTHGPIQNEADNGLGNDRGTIAMARTNDPHSANSQFFINTVDNDGLNYVGKGSDSDWGYAVFGKVLQGMEVVDAIGGAVTLYLPNSSLQDRPMTPTQIHRAVSTQGFPIMPDHSGSWFDSDNPGVGFNVEIGNDGAGNGPMAIVYWYNFDIEQPFWLTGQAQFSYGANEVTVDLYSHPGNEEGVDFQQPPQSSFQLYGTLTLSFDDCNTGVFSYDLPGYGSDDIQVTRLSRPDGFGCF